MSERTCYIPDTEEITSYLQRHGEDGVRYGSTVRDLERIDPRIAEDLHVHTPTGELVPAEAAISASDNLVVPVFYAAVFKPSRLNMLSRGAAVKPVRNDEGRVVDFRLFASDAAKQVALAVDTHSPKQANIEPTVYELSRRHFVEQGSEFRTAISCAVLGSAAVSLATLEYLGVQLEDLDPPNSDPVIRGFYEKYDYAEETPAT